MAPRKDRRVDRSHCCAAALLLSRLRRQRRDLLRPSIGVLWRAETLIDATVDCLWQPLRCAKLGFIKRGAARGGRRRDSALCAAPLRARRPRESSASLAAHTAAVPMPQVRADHLLHPVVLYPRSNIHWQQLVLLHKGDTQLHCKDRGHHTHCAPITTGKTAPGLAHSSPTAYTHALVQFI